jgi:hypothetical protein
MPPALRPKRFRLPRVFFLTSSERKTLVIALAFFLLGLFLSIVKQPPDSPRERAAAVRVDGAASARAEP